MTYSLQSDDEPSSEDDPEIQRNLDPAFDEVDETVRQEEITGPRRSARIAAFCDGAF